MPVRSSQIVSEGKADGTGFATEAYGLIQDVYVGSKE